MLVYSNPGLSPAQSPLASVYGTMSIEKWVVWAAYDIGTRVLISSTAPHMV